MNFIHIGLHRVRNLSHWEHQLLISNRSFLMLIKTVQKYLQVFYLEFQNFEIQSDMDSENTYGLPVCIFRVHISKVCMCQNTVGHFI